MRSASCTFWSKVRGRCDSAIATPTHKATRAINVAKRFIGLYNNRPEWGGAKRVELQTGRSILRPLQAAVSPSDFHFTSSFLLNWIGKGAGSDAVYPITRTA